LVQMWRTLSCFFFQAEDGIRDKLVTGVQTCALPICTLAFEDLHRTCGAFLVHLGDDDLRPLVEEALRIRETDALPRAGDDRDLEIGRASCRERVEIWVGAVSGEIKGVAKGCDNEDEE